MKINYEQTNSPIVSIETDNSTGYMNNVVNISKNGKAVRITNVAGEQRVCVTLDTLDEFIDALQLIRKQGVATSKYAIFA